MRVLKRISIFFLLPLVVLVDAHISQSLTTFFSHVHLTSHLIFLFLLFETIEVSEYLYLSYCLVTGLIYDIYFFHVIGMASLLFVLLGVVLHKYNGVFLLNRWTRMLVIVTLSFLFDIGCYLLAVALGITNETMPLFVVYGLVPSMLLNLFWMAIFQYIFEKIYL